MEELRKIHRPDVFQGGSGSQQGDGQGYDFVDSFFNPMGGSDGNDASP
jgi:hypothetical protein